MNHWGHLLKTSESLIFEFYALKADIYQCLTPNNFPTDSPNFHQTTPTDPFRVLIYPSVLHAAHSYLAQICTFLRRINLVNSAPVRFEKRVITVLSFSRPNFHGVQCNIDDPFHQDALPRIHWLSFMYIGINDPRMRIYLQHRRCFHEPAISVKQFICKMFDGPYCMCFSIDLLPYFGGLLVWMKATQVPNNSQIKRQISVLLRVKVFNIPHQLWTAYLSQIWPSPLGMKPVPDDRPGARRYWGHLLKTSKSLVLEF